MESGRVVLLNSSQISKKLKSFNVISHDFIKYFYLFLAKVQEKLI